MRWIAVTALALGIALWVAGCAPSEKEPDNGGATASSVDTDGDEPCKEQMEFAFLQYNWKSDRPGSANKGVPVSFSALLYTQGWIDSRTWGGPFEAVTKRNSIPVHWKHSGKHGTQFLYTYFYEHNFFDLPGSDQVDWTRFKNKDYSTKIMCVTRDDVRHIVFLEDVIGNGTDPRWDTFNDCVNQYLALFSNINDVHAEVEKSSFDRALNDYLKNK